MEEFENLLRNVMFKKPPTLKQLKDIKTNKGIKLWLIIKLYTKNLKTINYQNYYRINKTDI